MRALHWSNYTHCAVPRCPHCGHEQRDFIERVSWDDGEMAELDCENCRKHFVCVTKSTVTFSTAIDEDAANDDDWGPLERSRS